MMYELFVTLIRWSILIVSIQVPSLLGLLPKSLHKAYSHLMPDLARTIYQSYPSLAFGEPAFPDGHTEHAFTPALRTSDGGVDNIFFRDYQPLSVSTVTYAAWSLITSYGKYPGITKLLQEFDWIFIPTLNVDGYVYTWENDRLWRKNRQQTNLRFCRGLDLDHGFGFEWDGTTYQSNPCSESYPGDEPFQAVEAHRLAEWAKNETEHNG